jgi:hypothetical protein
MRTLLVSVCCLSLACLAGAAQQQQDQDNQHGKKKGGPNVQSPQVVTPPTHTGGGKGKLHTQGNVSGTGAGTNVNVQQNATLRTHHGKVTGQTQTNVSGQTNVSAKNTTFNKTVNKNITVNKNFQKQHFNLQTNKVVTKYKTVNFNANYKIAGAHNWKGAKYQIFVNYHPIWQPQGWWQSHYNHIVFIYGGWYYWNAGYWCPAWGYAPDSVYYFDGPIYASSPEEDPAQVVANVQSALQQQGYYQGEIDGVLGPQTRAALAEYQSAQGLEPTGAVDEPTLETLGMT